MSDANKASVSKFPQRNSEFKDSVTTGVGAKSMTGVNPTEANTKTATEVEPRADGDRYAR